MAVEREVPDGAGAASGSATEQEFAVIGLGSFGASLARRLEVMVHQVLGLDRDIDRVQTISDDITSAVALDATLEDVLGKVDISSFSTMVPRPSGALLPDGFCR